MALVRSPVYELTDKLLGGQLERKLRAWRSDGRTFDAIARELHDEGLNVTGQTVRAWCIRLGIHEAAK